MTMATLQKKDIEPFAAQVYEAQEPAMRKEFIDSLSARLAKSIEDGEQYLKDGKPLQTLDELLEDINKLKI